MKERRPFTDQELLALAVIASEHDGASYQDPKGRTHSFREAGAVDVRNILFETATADDICDLAKLCQDGIYLPFRIALMEKLDAVIESKRTGCCSDPPLFSPSTKIIIIIFDKKSMGSGE